MALSFDASTDGGNTSATSLTFAHTCTSADILWVFTVLGSNNLTSVTYNGTAMTQAVTKTGGAGNCFLHFLYSPTTGTNNVVITAGASMTIYGMASSYTGANQSGQPDATGSANVAGVGSGTWTGLDITSIADNCWAIMGSFKTFTEIPGATFGCTTRRQAASICLVDTNSAKTPAGSISMRVAHTGGSQNYTHVGATFSPSVPSSNNSLRSLTGMGF